MRVSIAYTRGIRLALAGVLGSAVLAAQLLEGFLKASFLGFQLFVVTLFLAH